MEHVKREIQKPESPFKDKFQHDAAAEAPTVNEFLGFNDENREESENGGADPFALAMIGEEGDHIMADDQVEDANQDYNFNAAS